MFGLFRQQKPVDPAITPLGRYQLGTPTLVVEVGSLPRLEYPILNNPDLSKLVVYNNGQWITEAHSGGGIQDP